MFLYQDLQPEVIEGFIKIIFLPLNNLGVESHATTNHHWGDSVLIADKVKYSSRTCVKASPPSKLM